MKIIFPFHFGKNKSITSLAIDGYLNEIKIYYFKSFNIFFATYKMTIAWCSFVSSLSITDDMSPFINGALKLCEIFL